MVNLRKAGVAVLFSALAGCMSMEQRLEKANVHYGQAINMSVTGQYEEAHELYDKARDDLTRFDRPPSDFYTESYYLAAADIEATRGYTYFLEASQLHARNGDWRASIAAADQSYRRAVEDIRVGAGRAVDIVETREKIKQVGKVTMMTVLGVAAAMADAGQTNTNMWNAYNNGASSYEVSNTNTNNFINLMTQAQQQGFFEAAEFEPIPLALGGSPDAHSVRFPLLPNIGIFTSIGRLIDITNHSNCTAFLLAPRVAVTNAHCVEEKAELVWVSEQGSKLPEEHNVLGWVTADGVNKKGVKSSFAGNDWAVVILAKSAAELPWLPLVTEPLADLPADSFSHALLAGYNSDLNSGYYLTAHFGCHINGSISNYELHRISSSETAHNNLRDFMADEAGKFREMHEAGEEPDFLPRVALLNNGLLHGCDTHFGSSGAPILVYSPKDNAYLVAGINQGMFKDVETNGPLRNARIGVSVQAFEQAFLGAKQIVESGKI